MKSGQAVWQPEQLRAVAALALLAMAFASIGIMAALLHRVTGYPGALRWSYAMTGVGALAAGTLIYALGWPL